MLVLNTGRHDGSHHQVIVLEKGMGIGDNLNIRWLTDKDLLIIHRNSLDQLVIEIRDLTHGTSKKVPAILNLTPFNAIWRHPICRHTS